MGIPSHPAHAAETVSTFSIVGYDPVTGDLGIAVESRFFAVGSVVPWAKAGVGAIATQSFANTTFGPKGLQLLEQGRSAQETLDALVKDDPQGDQRQAGIVDARGRPATWTGKKCNPWAGGKTGKNYTAQGNILTGKEVVEAMASTFEATAGTPLADRLVKALAAGQAAGGDSRGQQSAALLVVRAKGGYAGYNDRYIDLRVDDHPKPIEELARLLELHHTTNAYADARFYLDKGDRERAARIMEEATRKRSSAPGVKPQDRGDAYYDLACFYSLAKDPQKALENLEKAFPLNPSLKAYSLNDTDLDPLRGNPRYQAMVKDVSAKEK
ncbi:MAG TPA: DUF1028 domain-containing protein [Candidatus Polarisedimenticolia bacterium]|nr:DUF1028 domain-containing protein [Candidatus Polarisedimenticolia bacterium]